MDNLCIPIHLDAYAVSPGSCTGQSNLAPYTQPNYTSLRLDSHLIQHDVLDHVDFHLASPAWKNPRLADIGKPPGNPPGKNLKMHRMGIHLSWSLPRLYRSAQASGKSARPGGPKTPDPNPNPVFRPFPNRWMVVRHLINFKVENKLPEWQAWVVESDAVRDITSPSIDDSVDLESDISPFVAYQDNSDDVNLLRAQTEKFLGQRFDLSKGWGEVDESVRRHIPKLTTMSSSNPLFPDNALHNTNVLSMIDSFSYEDSQQAGGIGYLKVADCDYFVIGWHRKRVSDPLNSASDSDLDSKLSSLLLTLDSKPSDSQNPTRSLVHGAIYGVQYDFSYDPLKSTTRNLANEAAIKFAVKPPVKSADITPAELAELKMEPLSIGITPLDGILTFLEAHQGKDADQIFGTGGASLAGSLIDIAQLLYASGDNYDARVQAQDLIAQQNFAKLDGGSTWVFAKTAAPGQPAEFPSDSVLQRLSDLNNTQGQLDVSQRELASMRWELFALWWKYVSKFIPPNEKTAIDNQFRPQIHDLKNKIDHANNLITTLSSNLEKLKDPTTCRMTTADAFNSRTDPTLCIAGLDSGWPNDWQDTLTAHFVNEDKSSIDGVRNSIFKSIKNPLPSEDSLDQTALMILSLCLKNQKTQNGADGKPKIVGFQQWANRNPFVPIFIEWEGTYYHVGPFKDKWDVRLRPSPVGHAQQTLRYVPSEVLTEKDQNHKDFRTVSGRTLVLPQPVFSLEAIVKQVLDSAGEDTSLTDAQKTDLKNNIRNIQFMSAPLSGLTNHLLTRFEGAHVKPNVHVQGDRAVIPLKAAFRTDVEFDKVGIAKIDGESALTPYGDLFPFGTDQYPGVPFKPVTHGQLVLTKLNIVDKFGQAVCLPKVLRRPREPPLIPQANIYPCLSDWLAPDALENADPKITDKVLNTVFPNPEPVKPGKWPLCQYIQLTPAINQEARINASFLKRSTIDQASQKYSPWQEATDYDPMVFGWVIINYADNGLQFFLGDGTFYREIRKGGVQGTTVSPKWLPYPLPDKSDVPRDANEYQLSQLITQLRDPDYFQHFADSVNGSTQTMPFAPSDYAGYANSIIGKPLALVNVGWSLELAAPALTSQNTLGNPANDPYSTLHNYSFPLKIGDINRTYDGVVGFWSSDNSSDSSATAFQTFNTYFITSWATLPPSTTIFLPDGKTYLTLPDETLTSLSTKLSIPAAILQTLNPRIPLTVPNFPVIKSGNFLPLSPYYIPSTTFTKPKTDYITARTREYSVTTLLVDPYTSVHGYSPILPTKKLTIPAFVIQTAFDKMHAFFHLGPVLMTHDVPRTLDEALHPPMPPPVDFLPLPGTGTTNANTKPTPATNIPPTITPTTPALPAPTIPAKPVITLPISGRKGTWTWFQPYANEADTQGVDPTYFEMDVQEDIDDKKYEKPPYTFVEGLLQLNGRLDQKAKAAAIAGGDGGSGSGGAR